MSFWNELSGPVKGVAVVGGILIVLGLGWLVVGDKPEAETTQERGLQPPAP